MATIRPPSSLACVTSAPEDREAASEAATGRATEPATEAATPEPSRHPLTWVALAALVASAVLGSNVFEIRDRLLGSATPEPMPPAASRAVGAAAPSTGAEATRLRSQPWWQTVGAFEGTGDETVSGVSIAEGAIQWRLRWSCDTGRLVVASAGAGEALVEGACPEGGPGFGSGSGPLSLDVEADGPWRIEVQQQVDVPLNEPPLAAMSEPGAEVVSRGSFYDIDQTATGGFAIYRLADGSQAIRLEDFYVTPSPELEVRLSPLPRPATSEEYLSAPSELIVVLDVTTGSLNFPFPGDIDLSTYASVVIWCPPVNSAYAAATVEPAP